MERSEEQRLDAAFGALSDPTRRAIWLDLGRQPGLSTSELAARRRGLTRWAVMKHLAVLRDAGLVETLPEGRHRRHYRDERGLQALQAWLRVAGGE